MSYKRCRLTPDDTRHLMLMSVEGRDISDVRAGTTKEQNDMDELLSADIAVGLASFVEALYCRSVSVTVA